MRASTISAYFNCLHSTFDNIAPWRGLNKILLSRASIDLFDSDLITSKRLMALLTVGSGDWIDIKLTASQPFSSAVTNTVARWKQHNFHGGSFCIFISYWDYRYSVKSSKVDTEKRESVVRPSHGDMPNNKRPLACLTSFGTLNPLVRPNAFLALTWPSISNKTKLHQICTPCLCNLVLEANCNVLI